MGYTDYRLGSTANPRYSYGSIPREGSYTFKKNVQRTHSPNGLDLSMAWNDNPGCSNIFHGDKIRKSLSRR